MTFALTWPAASADEEQGELGFTDFIHLRAARVFTSGSDQPLPETLWRGRLSHVSAWSLGALRASKAQHLAGCRGRVPASRWPTGILRAMRLATPRTSVRLAGNGRLRAGR